MSARTVAVIDYGAGNLGNAQRAVVQLGFLKQMVRVPGDLPADGPILLPGVGNYGAAVKTLEASGVAGILRSAAAAGRRMIGVCLGLQLMFRTSEEADQLEGLGILEGRVRRLDSRGRPLPHLGWCPVGKSRTPMYFAHSYVVEPADRSAITATAEWGETFPAVIQRGALTGFQFHPERSGDLGLEVLAHAIRGEDLHL